MDRFPSCGRGTVTVLRLAGFPEAWAVTDAEGDRWSRHQRLVYGHRHFTLRASGADA